MVNEIDVTVQGMWEVGIKGTDIESLPDHVQEQFRVFFFSGAHSLLVAHDAAQKHCRSKEEYVLFMKALREECITAKLAGSDISLIDTDQVPEEKKPIMKLVVNNEISK